MFSIQRLSALLLLVAAAANANPLSLDADLESEAEGRLFFNNGGLSFSNNSITLQSVLAFLLIGLLFFLTIGQSFFGAGAGSGYGSYQQKSGHGYNNDQFYARSDKYADSFDNDLALLMKTLESFNVELEECQIYVACEASQINKHDSNGDLAKEVDAVLRRMRQSSTIPPSARAMVDAFNYGDLSYKQKKVDACSWFGDQCTEARKAKGF